MADNDQVQSESQEEETEETLPEETAEEQSEEADDTVQAEGEEGGEEEDLKRLVKGLQKGFTMTRQELAEFRRLVDELKSSAGSKPEEDYYGTEEEPLTKKDLIEFYRQQEEEALKAEKMLDSQIADLRTQGIIKDDKDEERIINIALKHKLPDLYQAADIYLEIQQAKKEAIKQAYKGKAKAKEGGQVGTSQKATPNTGEGIDYSSIRSRDFYDYPE